MKKILLILCFPLASMGQQLSCESGSAQLQQVIPMEGKSAADIYKLSTRWIAKNFHNKDKVIQSTIENELIRGDGYESKLIKLSLMTYTDLSYTFTIDIKEGKLRFTMNNMKSIGDVASYSVETYCCKSDGQIRTNSQSQNLKKSIEEFTSKLIASLNQMQNEKSDDW